MILGAQYHELMTFIFDHTLISNTKSNYTSILYLFAMVASFRPIILKLCKSILGRVTFSRTGQNLK
jgi:hypothetical protein